MFVLDIITDNTDKTKAVGVLLVLDLITDKKDNCVKIISSFRIQNFIFAEILLNKNKNNSKKIQHAHYTNIF